jgi:hypothetical protein
MQAGFVARGLEPRADRARAVELTGLDESFRRPVPGQPELYRQAIGNPPGARDGGVVNSARWRAAVIPAVNGHGTARAVAGLYAASLEQRLLEGPLLEEAISVQASGIDQVFGSVLRSVSDSASMTMASGWEAWAAAWAPRAEAVTQSHS